MAKQENPSQTTYEPLENLGREYGRSLVEEWNRERPPSARELRDRSEYLIQNPHWIAGRYARDIYFALKHLVSKARIPARRYTGRDVARLVDSLVGEGKTRTQARKDVAKIAQMEFDAVKQNHLRHGKSRRDKSR
jgi:hypothetical protein